MSQKAIIDEIFEKWVKMCQPTVSLSYKWAIWHLKKTMNSFFFFLDFLWLQFDGCFLQWHKWEVFVYYWRQEFGKYVLHFSMVYYWLLSLRAIDSLLYCIDQQIVGNATHVWQHIPTYSITWDQMTRIE